MRSITLLLAAAVPFLPSRASAAPQSGPPIEVLDFGATSQNYNPKSGVIQASDGDLYGTSSYGGTHGSGSIFKLESDSLSVGATILFDFDDTVSGYSPNGLIEGSDGALYGTTGGGGANHLGVLFKIQRDGTGFTVLHQFDGTDGESPRSNVIEGADGLLYGTTRAGGANDLGVVFQIGTDGTFFSVIYAFDGVAGSAPYGLIQAGDGKFYGTCEAGGASGMGSIFVLDSQWFGKLLVWTGGCLVSFDGAIMGGVPTNLIEGTDGALYGMTCIGGTSYGTLFKVDRAGTGYTVLKNLDVTSGEAPAEGCALVEGSDGALYGITRFGGTYDDGTVFRSDKDGGNFTVLSHFDDYSYTGSRPCGLIRASDGWLYGTTYSGNYWQPSYLGTVYRVDSRRASWTNYGSGLAGALGVPSFTSSGDPVIGGSLTLTVANSKSTPTGATLFMGYSRANLPLKGGTLLVGNVFFLLTTVIPGPQLTLTGTVPDEPRLAGFPIDMQWLEGDPAAPKGLSFTPGLEVVFGW